MIARQHALSRNASAWRNHTPLRAVEPTARRGIALLLLLVFLGLAAVFMAGWVTSAAIARRADRLAELRTQAAWLAESGAARAAAQLSRDYGYQGETWRTPDNQLAGGYTGIVEITIDRDDDADNREHAQAIVGVRLREGDETVVQTRKQVLIRLKREESS
jgi:hypothetical protein